MAKKRILWQLFPTYLIITFTAIFAVGGYSLNSLRNFYYDRTVEDLTARAWLVQNRVLQSLPSLEPKTLIKISRELGAKTDTRITIVDLSGRVLGDSHEDPMRMDDHSDRPEFKSSLQGEVGTSIRFSDTLGKRMMYVSVPLIYQDKIKGVVRTSIPVTFIDDELKSVEIKIAIAGLIIALLATGFSLLVSRRISHPIEKMKSAAVSISKGDQTDGLSIQSDSIEISALADALNSMVAQQNERIHTITNQRNKIETVLSSMTEGVLALDDQENVISLNNAAAKLFSVEVEQVEGRPFREIVRNRALLELASKTIVEGENSESDLVLEGENEKHLQVHGATLRDSQGKAVGAVIVLNDITKIRRLETIRRDFVANVSHELKTPITLIKGFVETLLQGAIDNRDESERFLKIMEKQVNRLNLIIDDLLSLSRLEQDHGRSKIDLEEAEVKVILESAIRDCELNTKNKSSTIQLNCEEGLKVPLNPPLIHQAVLNLVDNALKYSEPEALVEITASKNGSDLIIEVKDQGCGIDSKNLPRLFERFYRVDQARGRKLGGTGLGLAIVKHIAQAHGGRVSVDSTLGKGSRFSIHIPINQTPTDPGLAE